MNTKVICNAMGFQMKVEQFLENLLMGGDLEDYEDVDVRFVKSSGKFSYGGVADLFFFHDQWYYWTQDKRAKNYMTLADFELTGRLKYLEIISNIKIYPVIFAGFFTGYIDEKGRKIYTGDMVKTTVIPCADIPSSGGRNRARMRNGKDVYGYTTIAGVDSFVDRDDDYYYILDNCPIAMRYTKQVRVIGNVFYDLDHNNPNVNIANRCAMLTYTNGINVRNLHIKMAHAPYFKCRNWQEKALKVLIDEPVYEDLPDTLP